MRGFCLILSFLLCLGLSPQAAAKEGVSLAVLPYVNIGVSEENLSQIGAAFAQELRKKYHFQVKEGAEIRQKISSIPDGCPNDTSCVERVAQLLQVEQLLFFSAIDSGSGIDVTLSNTRGDKLRNGKLSLRGISSTDWKKDIHVGLSKLFGAPKADTPKSYKKTVALVAVGTVLVGSVTAFFLLQPTLGRVPN